MSLLAELEQAEAANGASKMVDVDLTPSHHHDDDSGPERWAERLCDALERQPDNSRGLLAHTRDRLLKLIGGAGTATGSSKPNSTDLAELVRNRDDRVAELTCEVCARHFRTRFGLLTRSLSLIVYGVSIVVREGCGTAGGPRGTRSGAA